MVFVVPIVAPALRVPTVLQYDANQTPRPHATDKSTVLFRHQKLGATKQTGYLVVALPLTGFYLVPKAMAPITPPESYKVHALLIVR